MTEYVSMSSIVRLSIASSSPSRAALISFFRFPMLDNLVTVAGQVLVLFLLIAAGYFCGKTGLVQQSAVAGINNLVLYIAIPCTLIKAFQLELTPQSLRDFLTALACAAGAYALFFPISVFLMRDPDDHRKRLTTLAATISNCNFMGFPLQTAVLGSMTLVASILLRALEKRMDGSDNYELVQTDVLTGPAGTYNYPVKGSPSDEHSPAAERHRRADKLAKTRKNAGESDVGNRNLDQRGER